MAWCIGEMEGKGYTDEVADKEGAVAGLEGGVDVGLPAAESPTAQPATTATASSSLGAIATARSGSFATESG
jgi:hypothetical protein